VTDTPHIRVAIATSGLFRLSDEAILLCVERGMTLEPELPDGEEFADGFDFFAWPEHCRRSLLAGWPDGQKYGVHRDDSNEFRSNPILLGVLEELGGRAMEPDFFGERGRFSIVEIPFPSAEGWHIRQCECSAGEYICEDHRIWTAEDQ
jgi:hypothetical protein